jgi:hypothetical protein
MKLIVLLLIMNVAFAYLARPAKDKWLVPLMLIGGGFLLLGT